LVSRKIALSKVDDRLTAVAKSLAEIWGYLGLFGAGCGLLRVLVRRDFSALHVARRMVGWKFVNLDGSDLLRKRKAEIGSDDCKVANIPPADICVSATQSGS
jgi:hypothetical protein